MHRRLVPLSSLLAASVCACAAPPLPASPEAEVPTRAEVFEIERLSKPAGKAAIAAVQAYHRKVCAPRQGISWAEEPQRGRRGCRLGSPIEELKLLQRLRDASPAGSPDIPKIIDRMIVSWIEVQRLVNDECASFRISPSPTTGDVEKAQQTLLAIESLRERAFTEPDRLCTELRERHPEHEIKAPCPPAGEAPDLEPPGGDWF